MIFLKTLLIAIYFHAKEDVGRHFRLFDDVHIRGIRPRAKGNQLNALNNSIDDDDNDEKTRRLNE